MKKLLLLLLVCVMFGCTENERARRYGGAQHIMLKKNEIVIGANWKADDLWYLTRDTVSNITYFREDSRLGIVEGKVIFK